MSIVCEGVLSYGCLASLSNPPGVPRCVNYSPCLYLRQDLGPVSVFPNLNLNAEVTTYFEVEHSQVLRKEFGVSYLNYTAIAHTCFYP